MDRIELTDGLMDWLIDGLIVIQKPTPKKNHEFWEKKIKRFVLRIKIVENIIFDFWITKPFYFSNCNKFCGNNTCWIGWLKSYPIVKHNKLAGNNACSIGWL